MLTFVICHLSAQKNYRVQHKRGGNEKNSGKHTLRTQNLHVAHATAGRVSYRLTPWVPNNQNAEVNHNTIRMANSTPPAMGSAQPG